MNRPIHGIVGAGGHGREVMPLAREILSRNIDNNGSELVFVVENLREEHILNNHRVVSLDTFLRYGPDAHFNIAIGNSKARERLSQILVDNGSHPFDIIAGNAMIIDSTTIGVGCSISPQTIITSNVTIGDYFQANCQCVISHDCRIGNFVTLAPGVKCNGNVVIEDHAYIGAGALIINGTSDQPLRIGTRSIIGMGAVVINDVKPFTTVVGNPAKVIKHAS